MIININGWPGVGKLTVARDVAARLDARLLDSHTVYNVAFSLTDFKTPAFYDAVRAVRRVAFDCVGELKGSTPVVMTGAYAEESPWGQESWDAIIHLARGLRRTHLVVVLDCAREENAARLQMPERADLRKLQDPEQLYRLRDGRTLLSRDADAVLRIDNTALTAAECAEKIVAWVKVTHSPASVATSS